MPESPLAERYRVLLDLARGLGGTLVADELYPMVYAQVTRVLPTSGFTVALLGTGEAFGTAFRAGEPRQSVDLDEAEVDRLRAGDYVHRAPTDGRAVLAAPLLRQERLLGCLAAERRRGQGFDAADAHFLVAVGRLAGVALDNARLFEQLQRRGEEAERLETVARDLNASLDLVDVAASVAAHAHAVVERPVVVWLREGDQMRSIARAGGALIERGEQRRLPDALAGSREEPLLPQPVAATAEAAASIPSTDAPIGGIRSRATRRPMPPFVEQHGRILVPLQTGNRLVGVLTVGPWRNRARHEPRLDTLRRMAPHAAAALENARLHAEVRRLSLTDPLVGLPNRRQLDLLLDKEFAAARRGRRLSFVIYDIDHFKAYNDTHGHRAGDLALIRFAEVLRGETRVMNLAARYGGEEFAAVLSETGAAGAKAHAERVRIAAQKAFDGALTVSAGVAECTSAMNDPFDLVVAADRALYRAKTDGRNRVRVANG